jgi:tetratricopeptide (TPR) repeat protein
MRVTHRRAAALLGLFAAWTCLGQMGGDLQAQILYAYQAEDSNQLADLRQVLSTQVQEDAGDMSLHYQLGSADYRYAQLASRTDARSAEQAFADCVRQLQVVNAHEENSVEGLVLESACLGGLAAYRKVEGFLLRSGAADRLARAYKLAPRNPRVLLLRASNGLARAAPGSAEAADAFAELVLAAQLFEESSATSVDTPGWGHAEAYLALGRQYLQRGDVLAARNWIEKSLLAAPDYRAAQRERAALVQR